MVGCCCRLFWAPIRLAESFQSQRYRLVRVKEEEGDLISKDFIFVGEVSGGGRGSAEWWDKWTNIKTFCVCLFVSLRRSAFFSFELVIFLHALLL